MALGLFSSGANALNVGDPVPAFEIQATGGKKVTQADLVGKWAVIFFYPKADTPGCTKEACSLNDSLEQIKEKGAIVLGVSLDDVPAQQKFKDKYGLQFELLADKEKSFTKTFNNLGTGGLFASRRTFIINPEGKVAHIIEKVEVARHNEQVLEVLAKLQAKE